MGYINTVLLTSTWLVLSVHFVTGQQASTNSTNESLNFMVGSSPATPNPALKACQSVARSRPYNVTYQGVYAQNIYRWCSTYGDVMPCLDRTLPTSNDVTDWFLKFILDQPRAIRMSKSMCTRFPFLANLTCAEEGMASALKCMEWSTKTSVTQFYSQFQPGQPLTQEKNRLASIYACITTVATAGCLHKKLTSCSAPKRKLIYDYYIMFSGKCRDIAGLQEPIPTSTSSIPAPGVADVANVTENVQKEDTKINNALESELDNKANTNVNSVPSTTPSPSRTKERDNTARRNQFVRGHQSSRDSGCVSGHVSGLTWWCTFLAAWLLKVNVL